MCAGCSIPCQLYCVFMKVYLSGKACCGAELCVFTCESEGMYGWASSGTVRGHREVFPAACLLSTSHHLPRHLTLAGLAGPRPGASGVQAKLLCKGLHPGSLLSGTRSPVPPPKFLLCVSAPAFLSLTASTSPLVHLLFRKCSLVRPSWQTQPLCPHPCRRREGSGKLLPCL